MIAEIHDYMWKTTHPYKFLTRGAFKNSELAILLGLLSSTHGMSCRWIFYCYDLQGGLWLKSEFLNENWTLWKFSYQKTKFIFRFLVSKCTGNAQFESKNVLNKKMPSLKVWFFERCTQQTHRILTVVKKQNAPLQPDS